MKWLRLCSAVVATIGLTTAVHANHMTLPQGASCVGEVKSCGCAPTCQPTCCKPTIQMPCEVNVYTYQRAKSCLKPPCCATAPAPVCCAPAPTCCQPAQACCEAPTCCEEKKKCCLSGLFGGKGCGLFGCGKKNECCCEAAPVCNTCQPAPVCAAPAPTCCAPAPTCCEAAPTCCEPKKKCCLSGLFGGGKGCSLFGCCKKKNECCCEAAPVCNTCQPAPVCAAPAPTCCEAAPANCCEPKKKCCLSGLFGGGKKCSLLGGRKGWGLFGCCKKQRKGVCTEVVCETRTVCCPIDPCELAEVIYRSQTSCYAEDRAEAIEELGETYSCRCNPEIMVALIYALNDAVEDVREEAAEQIGEQLEENSCCCTPEVISALTCALADCDEDVSDAAREALEACGHEVVEGCCPQVCQTCNTGCATGACGVQGGYQGGIPMGVPVAPEALPLPEGGEAAPAPAPPEDPKAYYPSQMRQKQAQARGQKNRLANLFGLMN